MQILGVRRGRTSVPVKGWLENFKTWISLHNFKITSESVSADHMAKGKYPENFKKYIIKEKNNLPQQAVNPDDAGLVWKKMPSCTFTFKNDKASQVLKSQMIVSPFSSVVLLWGTL
jgi:hypothetical protein